MSTLRKSLQTLGSIAAIGGLVVGTALPSSAQRANPCAPRGSNPCAPNSKKNAKKKGANPCAPRAGNPCAPKANPCAPRR